MARWLTAATALAVAATITLRATDGNWQIALGVTLALLAIRIALMVRDVARGQLPWTRLLLPAVIWIEGAGMAGQGMWEVRAATAIALEAAFVGAAIHALRAREKTDAPIEVRIARALEAIVPPTVARIAAIEMTIVGLAFQFVMGRSPIRAGFTYHRENGLRQVLPLLPLLAIGDLLLLELVVLPNTALWVRVLVHGLAAYGLIWLVGLYASARARPHRIAGERIELHRGVLQHLVIRRADIAKVAPMPVFGDAWKERAYKRASVRLDLGAQHVLEVTLRDGRRLLVGADEPAALERALEREPDLVTGA